MLLIYLFIIKSYAVDPTTKISFELTNNNDSTSIVAHPGDTINCSADGRPEPSYTW